MYDYELIVGDHGKRFLAFGKYAGRAGLIDFLHGLGMRMCQSSFTNFVMNFLCSGFVNSLHLFLVEEYPYTSLTSPFRVLCCFSNQILIIMLDYLPEKQVNCLLMIQLCSNEVMEIYFTVTSSVFKFGASITLSYSFLP